MVARLFAYRAPVALPVFGRWAERQVFQPADAALKVLAAQLGVGAKEVEDRAVVYTMTAVSAAGVQSQQAEADR
eukprot:11204019-Lingulodinium_polyedra.AAC.1